MLNSKTFAYGLNKYPIYKKRNTKMVQARTDLLNNRLEHH